MNINDWIPILTVFTCFIAMTIFHHFVDNEVKRQPNGKLDPEDVENRRNRLFLALAISFAVVISVTLICLTIQYSLAVAPNSEQPDLPAIPAAQNGTPETIDG